MSGDVLIPNLLVKIYKTFASSDIACSSSALLCIKTPMPGGVWIVSEGVWIESECVWGCINTKSVCKNV